MSRKIRGLLFDGIFIILGSAIYAVNVNAFTAPNQIAPGGVTGIATMINYLFSTPIGMTAMVINVPIIIWAMVSIGYKLVLKSLLSVMTGSVLIDVFSLFVPAYTGNPLLAAIFGGVCEGVGLGLVFTRGATTGGTDMIARIVGKRAPHFSMGNLLRLLDGTVVLTSVFVFGSIESAMYAFILIFVSTTVIDSLISGADIGKGKLFFIMSPKVRNIGDRIMKELGRGVTYLDSTGAYSDIRGETALCAVRRFEVYQTQRIIREEDSNAFVIIGDAGEISGEGFKPVRSDDKSFGELVKHFTKSR